ncbi:nuclear transport factor 2 family protein [Amycolatopsis sp. FDAARGOS 1241]|uniref:nuclear transport factor 2 family protein n=1 Tax=Amycolatopsis sp. FDAARGOS 1241 TaxID=2778070 RepID=UPI001951798E|nr:nuclear transport factor 2 family protein [Amycolatopsis sp. FDAARGOS 1241]QRP49635.1 nuclear transport factor 2 family protein [Amycolatopsis sp. FDAARGOS 1241]
MSDVTTTVEQYIAIWNETDAERRRALVAEVFTPDVSYTDPLGAVTGHDGIDGFIGGAQAQFAGLTFSLPEAPDAHHDLARFHWYLTAPGATEPLAIGFDVVELADGRITKVHGFLDKIPG